MLFKRPILHNKPDKIYKLAIIYNKGIIKTNYSLTFPIKFPKYRRYENKRGSCILLLQRVTAGNKQLAVFDATFLVVWYCKKIINL